MNLNRRVPNGLPGGVRGRKFYYFLLLDYIIKEKEFRNMISRKRILRFAIGKMLCQDGWAEKYNPKNQFHVNQYDYSTCKEYVNALKEKWQEYEDPECELEDYVDVSKYSN